MFIFFFIVDIIGERNNIVKVLKCIVINNKKIFKIVNIIFSIECKYNIF